MAGRINARLLDALCGLIYGDSEMGEDEALEKDTLAAVESVADGDQLAEPSLGHGLAAVILARYPLEKGGFDDWSQALVARYLSEYRQDLSGFAAEIAAGRFSPNAAAYELECSQLLEVATEDALVWKTLLYVYTGGAHGMQTIQYLNINPKTGEEITLDEVLKPEMRPAVRDRIRAKLSAGAYGNDLFDLMAVEIPAQFRLGGDSIVFQYQVYEIAPYVSGPIAVSLTKAELADCLR
ncbi:MAG: RsiV family protein [Bacteroidales bacterium]|nr:RsiV family protein [Bacteroidales bacterium]